MYIILDAAKLGIEIIKAKELNPEYFSFYLGKIEQSLSMVAPYLFTFNPNTEFGNWYMLNGYGNSWGMIVGSENNTKTLLKHFRHFLMVKKEDGEKLYFRFYDPRVLRVFLSTCDRRQLMDFFGSVDYFICEDENPELGLLFSLEKGELKTEKIRKEEILIFHPELKKKKLGWF